MSLSDIASISGVVSSLAVLVSLIYLALQIRQAAHNQHAETQASVTGRRTDYLMRLAEGDLAEAMMQGSMGDPETTPIQAYRFIFATNAGFVSWEDEYFQFRDGMLAERRFRLQDAVNSESLKDPGTRALWRMTKPVYHPDFIAHIDAIMEKSPPRIGDFTTLWKAAAAEERVAANGP
jgi:hypothetical protein